MGKNVYNDPPLPVVGGRVTFLSTGEWREGGTVGGWNATAECQSLFPDEIIRDSSEAARRRLAPQIQKTRSNSRTMTLESSKCERLVKHVPPSKC